MGTEKRVVDGGQKQRPCVMCQQLFLSRDLGNQICPSCRVKEQEARQRPYYDSDKRRIKRFFDELNSWFDPMYHTTTVNIRNMDRMDKAQKYIKRQAFMQAREAELRARVDGIQDWDKEQELRVNLPESTSITDVAARRKVAAQVFCRFVGQEFADVAAVLANELRQALGVPIAGVRQILALLQLGDISLAAREVQHATWLLAGNYKAMRTGAPLSIWNPGQATDVWCLAEVVSVRPVGDMEYSVAIGIHSGPFSGMQFTRTYDEGRAFSLGRKLGLGSKELAELVNLQGFVAFCGLFSKEGDELPQVRQWYATGSQQDANRALWRGRIRSACCRGVRPGLYESCAECPRGRDMGKVPDIRQYCQFAILREPDMDRILKEGDDSADN